MDAVFIYWKDSKKNGIGQEQIVKQNRACCVILSLATNWSVVTVFGEGGNIAQMSQENKDENGTKGLFQGRLFIL